MLSSGAPGSRDGTGAPPAGSGKEDDAMPASVHRRLAVRGLALLATLALAPRAGARPDAAGQAGQAPADRKPAEPPLAPSR